LVKLLLAPLAWLWLQGSGLEVRVFADETRISVGDDLVLTIQATARDPAPVQVTMPTPAGFEITGRSEHTEVSQLGTPSRTTTLELRLRALKSGHWGLGPARALQGTEVAVADPIAVQVDELPGAAATASNPMLKRLLERAPPPGRPGQPAVSLVLSSRTAAVGEQVDVLTTAWFPRELRTQLRRPPTLQPPVIEGVWSYPQPVPPGIAATRTVGGVLYDLFVAHQVIFPLQPGRVEVTPAVLKYSVPIALQFFSQEERYTLESEPEVLTVTPTPAAGRPTGYGGAVGGALRLDRTVESAAARAGEPVAVSFTLAGDGNPALWPAPDIRWPSTARAYPDRTDERLQVTAGRLGGSKTFRFTVVPDAGGPLALPGTAYPYYDLVAKTYRTISLAPGRLIVAEGTGATASRPLPPPLLDPAGPALEYRVATAVPQWIWGAIVLLPPLIVLGRRRFRRRRRLPPPPPADARSAGVELEALIRDLVGAPDALSERGLVSALRAVGVEPPLAARMVDLRARLQEARYGPAGGPVPEALAGEARGLAERLADSRRRRRYAVGGLVGAALLVATSLRAQSMSPGWQYEHGKLAGASDGFAHRTASAPDDPANWYDLGAAYYRLGLDGRAAGAWQRARRLAPRDRSVLRALDLVPPPESASAGRLWGPPFTWREVALAAAAVWLVGWSLIATRGRRRRELGVLSVVLALLLGAGALVLRARDNRALAVLIGRTPLQLSPHERAPTLAPLDPGTALLVLRRAGGWTMVDAPGDRLGWVPSDSLALLRGS
jgi:hypothetical protein